jgi:hypothetical protein
MITFALRTSKNHVILSLNNIQKNRTRTKSTGKYKVKGVKNVHRLNGSFNNTI